MEPLTTAYLANLAANLSAALFPTLSRRLQTALVGDEATHALERSLHKAIIALLTQVSALSPPEEALLADIFSDFLQQEDVLREIDNLLRGKGWDTEELVLLFGEAGYDAATLPGSTADQEPDVFRQAMDAFAAAFLSAAAAEESLRDTLQTDHLMAQTKLQQALLDEVKQMVALLQDATQVGIRAGVIQATNVVNGTQITYQWPGVLPANNDSLWEAHYLRTLLKQCDLLDIAAIDEDFLPDEGTTALRLRDVFTPLHLEQGGRLLTRQPDERIEAALQRHAQPNEKAVERDEKKAEPIPAVAAIAALPRLVVLGYPGGGKSTLVNYLAGQLAARRLGQTVPADSLPGWPADARPLPVRIVLRRFAAALPDKVLPAEYDGLVWRYIEKQMVDWGCGESFAVLKQTLLTEGGVIFFDGLDEVRETDADTRRSLIKEAIVAFADLLENCRVVVTCRDYAYRRDDAWRLPPGQFPVFSLPRFGREQIEHFTQTWYRQIGPLKGWTADRSRQEANKLAGAVQQYAHLRELAQYPLLLTLMAQVHGRDGFLPEDRADLYERAVKLLLAHWENRLVRDVEGGQQVVEPGLVIQLGIPVAVLRRALAHVAFAAHERQEQETERSQRTADIHRLDLQDELKAELGSADKAETVIRYIQQRAGLLQERDRTTYTFPHRTFQEYLAAAHIWQQADEDPVLMLKERVERDPTWWREVFLLAAGIQKQTPTTVGTLISELLYKEPPAEMTPLQITVALLAGQAVHDTGLVRQTAGSKESRLTTIYWRTQNWLLAIMGDYAIAAKERAAAGRILGQVGDPRPGVGVDPSTGLPDILWSDEILAGPYTIGDNKSEHEDEKPREVVIQFPYRLARYPITNAQFQSFIDAPDRDNPDWWVGIPEDEKQFSQPNWSYTNHPRETVSWYQAMAFCKWLTAKLHKGLLSNLPVPSDELEKYAITLPHEYEWEVAARWPNEAVQTRIYPWGPEFDAANANTYESGIRQTTAVGMYLLGKNIALDLYDLSGNVLEWCRNEYYLIEKSDLRRVRRGGSWLDDSFFARAADRNHYPRDPNYRSNGTGGFRLVLVTSSS